MNAFQAFCLLSLSCALVVPVLGSTQYCTKAEGNGAGEGGLTFATTYFCYDSDDATYSTYEDACEAVMAKGKGQRRRVVQELTGCRRRRKSERRRRNSGDGQECDERSGTSCSLDDRLYRDDATGFQSEASSSNFLVIVLAISLPLASLLGVAVVRKCAMSRSYNDQGWLEVEAVSEGLPHSAE